MIALVEQPIAIATVMAFSNALRVWIFFGVRSSQTISTMRRPHSDAIRMWPASAAGIEDAPDSGIPIDSAIAVIVQAGPLVMQVPYLRAMPASTSTQSLSEIFPARRSSQYFQASDPEPSVLPFQLPRNIGPAGK